MHQASSLGALLASLGGLYYEFNKHPKLFFFGIADACAPSSWRDSLLQLGAS